MRKFAIIGSLLALLGLAAAQEQLKSRSTSNPDWEEVVSRNFGDNFKPTDVEAMTGDFDGDGEEDVLLVATGSAVLASQEAFGFKVLDPYNSYFGYGNPKVTSRFGPSDGGHLRYLLLVHSWKAESAKAKFVLVNVPFQNVRLAQGSLKKKKVRVIETKDTSGLTAIIFWDGKKYRWEPNELD